MFGNNSTIRQWTIGLLLIAVLASASLSPAAPAKKKNPQTPEELVWPRPPGKPRLRWLAEYRTAEDFTGESGLRRALRKIIGQKKKGLFVYPTMVVTDGADRIFVSDTGGRRIVVLDRKKKRVKMWYGGSIGFQGPTGLAYSREQHRLYVADSQAGHVLALDDRGKVRLQIREHLVRPAGLAVDDSRDRLYVVDVRGHNIQVFHRNGEFEKTIGERGDQPGRFNFPNFIALDAQGYLYVSDMGNFRVQILDPEGAPLNAFGQPGKRPGDFMRPKGIAVDSENHIYVADAYFNNIQIFDIFGRVYLAVGSPGRNPGQFLLPIGIYIDRENKLYVLDQINRRLQVFEYLPSGEKAPSPGGRTPPFR